MSEEKCDIIAIKQLNGKEYFIVRSIKDNKMYWIPTDQLVKYDIEVGKQYKFQKRQDKSTGKYFLNYIDEGRHVTNKYYQLNAIYEFKIAKFDNVLNRKNEEIPVLYVLDNDQNLIKVSALKWQKETIWNFENVKCEVIGFSKEGIPRLVNKDFRHPIYKIDHNYRFKVIGQQSKTTQAGVLEVYELQGEDGCIHEVGILPMQKIAKQRIDYVECKVKDITTHLKLTQINIKDPYFASFDSIVKNNYLENKYFISLLEIDGVQNEDTIQVQEQYNSGSAFWVFTYTNKILREQFKDSIKRQDYLNAREINQLIVIFEEWILGKGIISSFPDEEIRKNVKVLAKKKLESARIRESVLYLLNKNPFNFLEDEYFFNDKKNLIERFFYVFWFSNVEILDCNKFLLRLLEIINDDSIESENRSFYLNSLLKQISYKKNVFITKKENEYFSLSSSKIKEDKFTINETKFAILSFCELQITRLLSKTEQLNILIGKLLKLFTKSTPGVENKEKLLFNAYRYFENYQNAGLPVPLKFDDTVIVDMAYLDSNNLIQDGDNSDWSRLEDSFNNKTPISIRLIKKSKTGYEVIFNSVKGFLPYNYIKDRTLRIYPFADSDFTISAICLSISRPFNLFIVEQSPNGDYNNSYQNNIPAVIGNIYDAIVKSVVEYGLFLSTNAGEGLLYINDIFDFYWDRKNLPKYFRPEQKIKVVLTAIDSDGKVSFSFKKMGEIDNLYYNEYVEKVLQTNINDSSDIETESEEDTYYDIVLNEKAFCIEQFAVLQPEIMNKLHNFKIAKHFYSSASNARSFLINIYISYFEILLSIKNALQNGSLKDIDNIKIRAQETRKKIDQKTIDTFPDSDKLIFFLDIISMFNGKEDSILDLLFEFIKKYKSDYNQRDLKTIAKITLANNLLISESTEDSDFSLKNLRLIYDYLSNGILTLEETIDDRNARELKEEILYWQKRIRGDESETLEFKSSFFTPILDDVRKNRLENLKKNENPTEQIKVEISRINGDLAKKAIIHSALKTLAAFANSSGGTLIIGVDDKKQVVGLEQEYKSLTKSQGQNRDGFGKYFDDTVRNYLGDSFSSLMSRRFLKFPNGDVLIIKVEISAHEVFLLRNEEGKESEQLFIRNLSSSKELTGSELAKYIKNKSGVQEYKNKQTDT